MALKNIKELIENKGYVIKPQDRKIFEQGDLQSFFGFSNKDAVEFIIYDVNDNQLPQPNGELVRYINLTDENIRDYVLIPEGTLLQQFQLPDEYFIDVERLLNEAGYSNGIFKTQVSLVNKRAGSEKEFDKLWIQEISPSRTEVRLFPLKQGVETNQELKERFETFVSGRTFREDVIQAALEAVEQVSPQGVTDFIRGKYGERWYDNFIREFKIKDIESFNTQIYTSFLTSILYEFTNRNSKIGTNEYGSKKNVNPPISLTKQEVVSIVKRILIESIYYYLPERDINKSKKTLEDFLPSEDLVSDILQRESSDTTIKPRSVEIIQRDVVKRGSPAQNIAVQAAIEEIKEEVITNEEINEEEISTEEEIVVEEEIEIVTPDDEIEIEEIVDEEDDDEPIIDFDEFFDIVNDIVVPLPIDDGIDFNDDRVDIPDEIVIDDEVFPITPLPIDIAGGSPVGGEGEQGQPQIGGGGTRVIPTPDTPGDKVERKRKTIREL